MLERRGFQGLKTKASKCQGKQHQHFGNKKAHKTFHGGAALWLALKCIATHLPVSAYSMKQWVPTTIAPQRGLPTRKAPGAPGCSRSLEVCGNQWKFVETSLSFFSFKKTYKSRRNLAISVQSWLGSVFRQIEIHYPFMALTTRVIQYLW